MDEFGYQEYRNEWLNHLRREIFLGGNGEVARCFWGALGPKSFLFKAKELERYSSFMFTNQSGTNETPDL